MKSYNGMLLLLTLSLMVICVQSYKTLHQFEDHGSGPEDKWTAQALEMLGRSPQILNILLTANIPHKDILEKHLQQIPVPKDNRIDAMCLGCRTVMTTLNILVNRMNVTFDDVRDVVVTICVVGANAINLNGNVLCPGTIDNYGPHVVDIIKISNARPRDACRIYNYCPPELPEMQLGHPGRSPRSASEHQKQNKPKEEKKSEQKVSKKNFLKIAHMTDIHVDHKYMEGAAIDCGLPTCCRLELDGEGSARRWGEYRCNIPPGTTTAFLRRVGELDPDFVVYTGDNPPHSIWEETLWGQLNISRWVAQVIGENFPGKRAYSTMGNHETYPSNLYYKERPEIEELNREWFNDWAPLSFFDMGNQVTIHNAGYYSKLHHEGLRILAYNSNFGYTENWYVLMNDERLEYMDMKNFLSDTLAYSRANGEKVILLGHHPSGSGVLEFDKFMADLTNEYHDVIVLHVMGHTHNDEFRVDVDETGAANHVEFVGQTMNSRTNINPGFRMFYLDPDTYEVQDYDQYYIDLNTADADDDDPVTFLYSAREEFGLADMSAASWRDLIARMADDDELFQRYYRLRNSNSNPDAECTGTCKVNMLCRLASNSYDRQLICRRDANKLIQH